MEEGEKRRAGDEESTVGGPKENDSKVPAGHLALQSRFTCCDLIV